MKKLILLVAASLMMLLTGCDKMANNALGKKYEKSTTCTYFIDSQVRNDITDVTFGGTNGIAYITYTDTSEGQMGGSRVESRCITK